MARERGNLDCSPDDHNEPSQNHSFSPAQQVANTKNEYGTYETSDLVDSCDQSLHSRVVSNFFEYGGKVIRADNTAHPFHQLANYLLGVGHVPWDWSYKYGGMTALTLLGHIRTARNRWSRPC